MKILKHFVFAILLSSVFQSAKSQWTPCQGIEGASTSDIMARNSELFIITSGNGIFKRNLIQNSWDSACLAGSYWKIRSTENALFCYGPMTYFYRSMDDGASWIYNENYSWVYDLEVSDNVVFIIYDGMVMRSMDEGESWIMVQPESNSAELDHLFAQNGQVFCTDYSSDTIFQTIDNGENWIKLPGEGFRGYINDIYLFHEKIWMATDTSIYIFDDLLNTWSKNSDSIPAKAYPQSFFEFDNELFCCTNKGLFIFNDQDTSWNGDNEGLESLGISCGFPKGDTVYLATGAGPFYRPEGSTWISDYNDLFQLNVKQIFTCGLRTYANVQGKLFYSDDVTNGFNALLVQGNHLFNKIIVTDTAWFAGTKEGFAISLDSGLTWNEYSEGLGGKTVYDIAITDRFYFAKIYPNPGIYRTRSDSISWGWLSNEIDSANVWGVTAINNVVFASVYSIQGLYKSDDYGETFNVVPEGGDYAPELFVKDDMIFLLMDYSTVYFSNDDGETWQTWLTGFDEESIGCMDLTDDHETTILGGAIPPYIDYYLELFTPEEPFGIDICDNLPAKFNPWISNVLFDNGRIMVTLNNYGLWYRDDLAVGISDKEPSNNASYSQLSIYPNPAKEIINIHYDGNVEMTEYQVVDYSGKIVMKGIMEDGLSVHSVNVSGLPQGIYLIMIWYFNNLTTGKFIKTN